MRETALLEHLHTLAENVKQYEYLVISLIPKSFFYTQPTNPFMIIALSEPSVS